MKDVHLVATSIVKLQVISHQHCTTCSAVINLDRQRGREIDGPSVIASFVWQSKSWFCMLGMRPSWLCLQFKAVIHCVWGKSRISLGHVIFIGACRWDLCCSGNGFCRSWSIQVGTWCSVAEVGCLYHCCTHCAPNAQLRWYNRYGKKCSLKTEILRVMSWHSISDLACAKGSLSTWSGSSH